MTEEPQCGGQTPGSTSVIPTAARVLIYLIVLLIATSVVQEIVVLAALIFGANGPSIAVGHDVGMPFIVIALSEFLSAIAVLVLTFVFVIYLDRRPPETIGFNRSGTWGIEIVLGLFLGVGMMGLMFFASYLAGWSKVTGAIFGSSHVKILVLTAEALLFWVSTGIVEETMMRGYVQKNLECKYGAVAALVITSITFGLMHSLNPGASIKAFIGTTLAGFILGYAFLATGRLWLPIAFHFSWNCAEGLIFGFPVSGMPSPAWIQQKFAGPVIWTGGKFGPEAGLMTPLVLILGTLIIWWFRKTLYRSGRIQYVGAVSDREIL